MKVDKDFDDIEVEEEEFHLKRGLFYAFLFESLGIIVIWGLIKILLSVINLF